MSEMGALIAKLEAAGGANFELERSLAEAAGWRAAMITPFDQGWVSPQGHGDTRFPAFTASLDAAVRFVESMLPGTEWAVSTLYGRNHAEVNMNAEESVTATGATLPIALCLAALKARSQGETSAPADDGAKDRA